MLDIPSIGMSYSVDSHNVKLDVLCDWIEGSVLFCPDRLSERDVVDALHDNGIYKKKDMATDIVSTAWSELRKRQKDNWCLQPVQV